MIASRRFGSHPLSFLFFSLCFLLLPLFFADAQSATTGAIGGTVSDTGGALLPAATVTVKSNDTGATLTVKTNASGEYRVPELAPGTYTATFAADGFGVFQANDIAVTVGSLSAVSPVLKPGSTANSIEVTDEAPLLHTESSDISTTLDKAAIDNLPINGRRWSDFALLTPGVVSNSDGYGLLSFRGISFLLNNNTVDGADDNQAYFSEARGRTRLSYAITQAAIQEFQVNTSNYSAQYGRSAGGVINTVTKSGSNQTHGELFFYDRDNDLAGATNPYTLLNTFVPANDDYTSMPYKPTDWRKQWGFGVGGPLLRNKLFWFYAYDQSKRNFPGTAVTHDPNDSFAPSNTTLPAGETCTGYQFTSTTLTLSTEGDYNACAIAALFGMGGNFQAGSAYYQQGLAIMSSFLGTVPRTGEQVINLPKIDYQINDRNHFSVMYNRLRYSAPNGLYQPSTETEGRSGWGDDFVKEDFGIARLSTQISNTLVNEALVQYGRDFEYTYQNPPLPNEIPMANNAFGAAPGTQIGYNFESGFYAGANPDLPRAADPDERRLQLLDGLTWVHGKHVAKAGLEYNKVYDYVNNLYNGNGSYSYDYSYTFISDYLNAVTGAGGPGYTQLYYSYSQEFGNPSIEIATREYAGYATDDWRVLPNLTLTLGLRYEYEYVPQNPYPNTGNPAIANALDLTLAQTALPQTADRPDDRDNIAPRVGFAWNIFGNNKTTLRGGYGIYYGRIINSNILQTYLESGAPDSQISVSSLYPGHCGPAFPSLEPSFAASVGCLGATTTVAYLDPHMKNPQVHETDLAIERDLGHNTVLGITYMGSFGRELPRGVDTNFDPAATGVYAFTIGSPASSTTPLSSYPISSSEEATFSSYPQPANTGYMTHPLGGAKLPFQAGKTLSTKVFLLPVGTTTYYRPDPAYGEILDIKSDVNSSYNALSVQVNHRFEHGFSLLTNYTWSHALDDNPYESTVVPTYTALDPTDLKLEHGNSSLDVRQRFVFAAVYQPETHFHGLKDYVLGGWRIAPMVQAQNGLPYTPYVSGSASAWSLTNPTGLTVPIGTDGCTQALATVTGAQSCPVSPAYKGLNGSGSSADRLPWIDRNTYTYPKTIVVDGRLGKNFYLDTDRFGRYRLEVFAEVFNIMNHQNITGVNNDAYAVSGTTLTPYANFGQNTNANSNYTYSPRQVQIAARLHF